MSRISPILFNTEMVRAITDNRKTVTRRLIKLPYFVEDNGYMPMAIRTAPKSSPLYREIGNMPYPEDPYRIGGILYVRETWAFKCCLDCMDIAEDDSCMLGKISTIHEDKDSISEGCYIYRADHPHPEHITWRPSIHMPKAAARIWLRVTDVRVERLLEATNPIKYPNGKDNTIIREGFKRTCDFIDCWNSTIKRTDLDKYGWDANPWVWVIEFERCENPEVENV